MGPLRQQSEELRSRRVRARELLEPCLERIASASGEGARAFIKVTADAARRQADEVDRQRSAGHPLPAFAGIALSVKDLFDIAGEVTTAGSKVLRSRPAAASDATVVARVRAAGFIFVGRTNMTEFAYSGLGINPHYGTPLSPYERAVGRIPGGSSSGAAIAVSDGMAAASLGTDTGGSCRIPAALTGTVGFKPTARRIPRDGVIPLSTTLDSVGTLTQSVACSALLDAILASEGEPVSAPTALGKVRLLVPTTLVLDDLDRHVASAFERALSALARAGAAITRRPVPQLTRIPELNAGGGIAAYEAFAWHRDLLESHAAEYDPRVATRILKGRDISPESYGAILRERAVLIERLHADHTEFDALLMPTVPVIAPPLTQLQAEDTYFRANGLLLRNPSLANFLDRCSISLPMQRQGEPPSGLMLIGARGADRHLLSVALAVESALR